MEKKATILKLIFVIVFCLPLEIIAAQLKSFSDIHDTINKDLSLLLEDIGFGKITYYYDEINMIDGRWHFYPMIELTESLIAVGVSKIPDIEDKYTYILLYNLNSQQFTDTLGPFYDSMIDAIKVKIRKNEVYTAKVRLHNPPEPFDPRYTYLEYKRIGGKLIETKQYYRK